MTFHPMNDARAVEYRKQQMMREAKMHHLMREAIGNKTRLHERLLALVGDVMVESGTRLKERFDTHERVNTRSVDNKYAVEAIHV